MTSVYCTLRTWTFFKTESARVHLLKGGERRLLRKVRPPGAVHDHDVMRKLWKHGLRESRFRRTDVVSRMQEEALKFR